MIFKNLLQIRAGFLSADKSAPTGQGISHKWVTRGKDEYNERNKYMKGELAEVHQRLCRLHMEICELVHGWPMEESYELKSRMTRSSKCASAQFSGKDCHGIIEKKNKDVNRSKGEVAETIHLLFMAKLRGYITEETYMDFRSRFIKCLRILNRLEKTL